jgi:hypothetical protein
VKPAKSVMHGLALAALLAGAVSAGAADYPYSGRLTLTPSGISAEQAQYYCAYNFFNQKKDGSFTGYHLDLARFRSEGTVKYLTYQKGTCTLDAGASIESCLMRFDTDPEMQGRTFIDFFRVLESGVIAIFYFESIEGAREFAATGDTSRESDAQFVQCDDPGGKSVDKYLTDDASRLSPEERYGLTGPEMNSENLETMKRVIDAISAGK